MDRSSFHKLIQLFAGPGQMQTGPTVKNAHPVIRLYRILILYKNNYTCPHRLGALNALFFYKVQICIPPFYELFQGTKLKVKNFIYHTSSLDDGIWKTRIIYWTILYVRLQHVQERKRTRKPIYAAISLWTWANNPEFWFWPLYGAGL